MSYRYWSAPLCPIVLCDDGSTEVHIADFLITRKFTESIAYSTVESDARHLAKWLRYLTLKDFNIFNATTLDIESFRDLLVNEGLSKNYINKHLASICAFYWFAQREGYVTNMIGWIDKAKAENYRIVVHKQRLNSSSPVEYRIPYLLNQVQSMQKSVPSYSAIQRIEDKLEFLKYNQNKNLSELLRTRDKLIFRWLKVVGLRREELVSLKVNDIPKGELRPLVAVYIHNGVKFNKPRMVEVPRTLIQETLDYIEYERCEILQEMRGKFGNPSKVEFLFVNGGNNAVAPQMNAQTVYKFLKKLDKSITPHALRRFALTRFAAIIYRLERKLSSKSGDEDYAIRTNLLARVAKHAGHENIDTTIKYYVDFGISIALEEVHISNLGAYKDELELELAMLEKLQEDSAQAFSFE